jgi:hypothetical protein
MPGYCGKPRRALITLPPMGLWSKWSKWSKVKG